MALLMLRGAGRDVERGGLTTGKRESSANKKGEIGLQEPTENEAKMSILQKKSVCLRGCG
jgi:hypothetical protein